jgi:hypothetical protein
MEGLAKLLVKNERLVVLCVDESVDSVESELINMGIKNVVLGVRAAKGLEFTDVVLVNMFGTLDKSDQAIWKTLFSSANATASSAHPHIELQLKLLYTAITRGCNRLLFVETEKTQLSSTMFRWLVSAGLAEMFNAANEEAVLMTSDEWRAQGIEFALSAEGDNVISLLEKAVKCFQSACDEDLQIRAETQLALTVHTKQLIKQRGSRNLNLSEQQALAYSVFNGLKFGYRTEVKEMCSHLKDMFEYSVIFEAEVASLM